MRPDMPRTAPHFQSPLRESFASPTTSALCGGDAERASREWRSCAVAVRTESGEARLVGRWPEIAETAAAVPDAGSFGHSAFGAWAGADRALPAFPKRAHNS